MDVRAAVWTNRRCVYLNIAPTLARLEKEMNTKGKSLTFSPEEIADLLDMEYGDRRLFPLLSLLYPFVDSSQLHHIDHFYPRSTLQQKRLERAGCDSDYAGQCVECRDRLPNMMLLEGSLNNSKNDTLPLVWMNGLYPNTADCKAVAERNDVGLIPSSPQEFMAFFEDRKERIRERLATMLA
jgi:hypothetical protein